MAADSIFCKKKVIVGVTGSIAAYKAASICRRLVSMGSEVFPVMTPNALNFINPITFNSICRNKTTVDQFEKTDKIYHISLAQAADIILIAPATANTISKLANGICDNFLTTISVSSTCPVLVAPAMNENMYLDDQIQENIKKLKNTGRYFFIGPDSGDLACGQQGMGRMIGEDEIISRLEDMIVVGNSLEGRKVLVTAGGTREYIDDVRYITNESSGKMGYALAEEALFRNAEKVFFINTIKDIMLPAGIDNVYVESATDMKEEIEKIYENVDTIIMTAAVSDIVPIKKYDTKIKKKDGLISKLKFKENINILNMLSEKKAKSQRLIGFSAEYGENHENTLEKIKDKKIDLMILNDISRKDIGFNSDFNEVSVLNGGGLIKKIKKNRKRVIARKIWDEILNLPEQGV